MAMKVGELFAALGLDDREYNAKLAKAGRSFEDLGKKIGAAGTMLTKSITLPLVAIGAAAIKAATSTADYAEHLTNLSRTSGLTRKQLQELQFIADQGGFAFEGLTNASSMLTRKLMGVEQDTGNAAKVIKALGIDVHTSNGSLRSMSDMFPEIIKRLQSMTNVTQRNMMASQIFGRSLADVAPLLGMTAKETQELIDKGHRLGIVMGDDALRAADKLDEQIDDLKAQFTGLWRHMQSQLLPVFNELIPVIKRDMIPIAKDLTKQIGGLMKSFSDLSPAAKRAWIEVAGVVIIAGPVIGAIGRISSALKGLIGMLGAVRTAAIAMTTGVTGAVSAAAAAVAGMGGLIYTAKKAGDAQAKSYKDELKKELKTLTLPGIDANIKALEKWRDDWNKNKGYNSETGKWAKPYLWSSAIGGHTLEQWQVLRKMMLQQPPIPVKVKLSPVSPSTDNISAIPKDAGIGASCGAGTAKTNAVNDALDEFSKSMRTAIGQEKLLGDGFDLNAAKSNIFETALRSLLDAGLKPNDARVKAMATGLGSVRSQIEALKASGMPEMPLFGDEPDVALWGTAIGAATEDMRKGWESIAAEAKRQAENTQQAYKDLVLGIRQDIAMLGKDDPLQQFLWELQNTTKWAGLTSEQVQKVTNLYAEFSAKQKQIDDAEKQAEEQKKRDKEATDLLADATERLNDITGEATPEWQKLANELKKTAIQSPLFAEDLKRLAASLEDAGKKAEEAAREAEKPIAKMIDDLKKRVQEGWSDLSSAMKSKLQQVFISAFKGKFNLKTFWKGLWDDMLSILSDALAKMAMQAILTSNVIKGAFSGGLQIGGIGGIIGGALSGIGNAIGGIFGLAEGGIIRTPGPVLVGERGPEMLNLPRGAQVTPLDRAVATQNVTVQAHFYGNISSEADVNKFGETLARHVKRGMALAR